MNTENKIIDTPKNEQETNKKPVISLVKINHPKKVERKDGQKFKNKDGKSRQNIEAKKSEYEEAVVDIARVTKVVKGGRRFSFSATIIVGNRNGKVGLGHGKANEVPDAIKKAIKDATKNVIVVPIVDNRTIPHEAITKFLATKLIMKPAPQGRGLITAPSVRMVVELAGYRDIYSKAFGSRSKQNMVKAAFKLLKSLRLPEAIANSRDKTVEQILGRS